MSITAMEKASVRLERLVEFPATPTGLFVFTSSSARAIANCRPDRWFSEKHLRNIAGRMAVLRGWVLILVPFIFLDRIVREQLSPSLVSVQGGQGEEGFVSFKAPELSG